LPVTYLPKKWYSLSGLIVGSMTPDFEYFIRMKDYSKYSHTWDGLFLFDVPLGLILLFVFHNVVRDILIGYLPFSLNIRLSAFSKFSWNNHFRHNVLVVLLSLIVGIASHIFWDSFTHSGGYFFHKIAFLEERVNILNHQIHTTTLLQYVSSLIGGLIMLVAVFKLPEGRNTKNDNILNFWLLVSLVMISVVNVRLYLDTILNHHKHEDIIVTTISGALIGITGLSFLLKRNNKRQRQALKFLKKIKNK
ncbi:MAG: DUF4184 family protein, partial [Ginsengibacter sp.]